jgi:ADP-ribose pyrophosphatase YjhB (NUDIX family)
MTNPTHNTQGWLPSLVACAGAVVLQGKQALFVRQAVGASLEGQWSIPWGLINPAETPEAAALRETREESAIEAEVEGLLGIQNLPQSGWLGIIFLCRHISGTPTSDGGIETDQAAYLSLEQMDALAEPFEPWCEWLVRRVLQGEYHIMRPERDNPYQPRLAFL